MKLIVGLGNPGARYAKTRHNVGFMVLDRWSALQQAPRPLPSDVGIAYGAEAVVLKPDVFMNDAGSRVTRAAADCGARPEDTFVICDDLNLPLGHLRLRGDGSSGGHRGLQSVIDQLGTMLFPRLRVGIGAAPAGVDPAVFVLSPFTPEESRVMDATFTTAAQALDAWVHDGLPAAMNQFNRRNLESP